MEDQRRDWLVSLRRDLHRHPEPAWCEFYTTARIVEAIEGIEIDELHLGQDVLPGEDRLAVPPASERATWEQRAIEAGADPEVVAKMDGGYTGAVAVLRRGDGPTIGLRVDIDGLQRPESEDQEHSPVAEGFRSENPEMMHACGHDAHATIGVGVLEAVAESEFTGTFKVFFQPAEEEAGGGKPMAQSPHLADVEYLLALHIGLDNPTGEVVAGIGGFYAVKQMEAEFTGTSAHAGKWPNEGANANQALATAVNQLYAIPRHRDGATRVNAGEIRGGTASNIIAEEAHLRGEIRGEETKLMDYMWDRATRVLNHAAAMHGCSVEVSTAGEAPSAESDQLFVDIVQGVSNGVEGVNSALERGELGASEDATYLMRAVQQRGGLASYVGIGTDHPGGHHTATFDVDEDSIPIGVDVLSGAVLQIARDPPPTEWSTEEESPT